MENLAALQEGRVLIDFQVYSLHYELMVFPPTEMENAGKNSDLEDSNSILHLLSVKGFQATQVGL